MIFVSAIIKINLNRCNKNYNFLKSFPILSRLANIIRNDYELKLHNYYNYVTRQLVEPSLFA